MNLVIDHRDKKGDGGEEIDERYLNKLLDVAESLVSGEGGTISDVEDLQVRDSTLQREIEEGMLASVEEEIRREISRREAEREPDQPVDGEMVVAITEDEMRAYATFRPSRNGGDPLTLEGAREILRERGVVFGIDVNEMRNAMNRAENLKEEVPMVMVAQGIPMSKGTEPYIVFHLPLPEEKLHQLNRGEIDLTEDDGVFVEADMPIAASRLGDPPVSGKTVTGKAIPPPKRQERRYVNGRGVKTIKFRDRVSFSSIGSGFICVKNSESTTEIYLVPAKREDVRPVHGSVEVRISEDKLRAYATLTPAKYGGEPVSLDMVDRSLRESGIVFGVKLEAIKEGIERVNQGREVVEGLLVAEGVAPQKGGEPKVSFNFSIGSEDIYDRLVEREAVVASATPGSPGKSGNSVTGEEIPPPVPEPPLVAGENVREVKVGERWEYIAKVEGIATLDGRELKITPYADGKAEIGLDGDKIRAYLTLIPPVGEGKPIKPDDVASKIREMNIKRGLKVDVIKENIIKCLRERVAIKDVIIAEGVPPVPGEDGRIEYKFETAPQSSRELSGDRVDHRDRGGILNVRKGDTLASIIPPTPGGDGINLMNEVIPAPEPKPFDPSSVLGENVHLEGDAIVSDIDGRVSLRKGRITVRPIFECENVDYSTGHINFVGDVVVNGDVLDGFMVNSGGDVLIRGTVNASTIIARGDVTVLKGFLGRERGIIDAEGDVSVLFVENGRIESRGSITIRNAALHSELIADKDIVALEGKGVIIGGTVTAAEKIEVMTLGADVETHTQVQVGISHDALDEINDISRKTFSLEKQLDKINQVISALTRQGISLEKLSPKHQRTYAMLLNNKEIVQEGMKKLRERRNKILGDVQRLKRGEVIAHGTVYPGVKISIGYNTLSVKSTYTNVRFKLSSDGRRVEALLM
ncbi:MAG: flagellar assembly protein A [bacterium]